MTDQRDAVKSMRAMGRMCVSCTKPLDLGVGATAWAGGERFCDRCGRPKRVALCFKYEQGVWRCDFLDPVTRTPVAAVRCFHHADTIREMVSRTPTRMNLEAHQVFDLGLSMGRGAVDLELTAKQFLALKEGA